MTISTNLARDRRSPHRRGLSGDPDRQARTQGTHLMPTEIEVEHARTVRRLRKPGIQVVRELTGHKADAVHMALGIAGETGELIDAVKKWAIYGKPLDIANVVEELGDLEFYLEGLRQCIGLTRNDTLRENVLKLSKRYSAGHYSDRQAQQRADKEPGQ